MFRKSSAIALALLLVPALAHAHTTGLVHMHNDGGPMNGLFQGLSHPLHGLDHLLAMIAVGLWAAQMGGRSVWAVPASFVGIMALGGVLGMMGVQLPMVETGIMTSVLLLGLLIAFAVRLPLWASMSVVGFFALFHGFAHGAEMPSQSSGLLYAAGFIVATSLLHLGGIGLGVAAKNIRFASALRLAGALVILGGVVLAFN